MMQIEDFLVQKGFKLDRTYGDIIITDDYWLPLKGDIPKCGCNDKLPNLFVKIHRAKLKSRGLDDYNSVDINIKAEANEIWANVGAYSMLPEEFMEKYDQIVHATVEAWKIFYLYLYSNVADKDRND